jgi:hypothetical protein
MPSFLFLALLLDFSRVDLNLDGSLEVGSCRAGLAFLGWDHSAAEEMTMLRWLNG